MKSKNLSSIAHNIADSLASGVGLMIGVYGTDIFGEASRSPQGFIEVDFLTGATRGGAPSRSLAKAISLYSEALPDLCEKQNASVSDYRKLTARYSGQWPRPSVVVEVENANGKVSVDRYIGVPLQRPRVLDRLGRVRRLDSA